MGKREKIAGRAIVASEAMTRTADCARCRCHGEGDATRLREADDQEAAVQEAAARSTVDSRGPTACHSAVDQCGACHGGSACGFGGNEAVRGRRARWVGGGRGGRRRRAWEGRGRRRSSVRGGRRPLMEANRARRWSPRWQLAWRVLLGQQPNRASEVVRQGLWAGGLLRGALHVSSPPTTQ